MDNHVAIYGSKVAEGFSVFQRRSCFSMDQENLVLCGYQIPAIWQV